MATAPGHLAISRPAAVPPNLVLHELPVRVDPGIISPVISSLNAIRIDHYGLSGVAIIVDARSTAIARQVTTLVVVFAIGFASALLYGARPVEHALIRLSLPEPKPISEGQKAGMREQVFVKGRTQPQLATLAPATPVAIASTTNTAPARPALSSTRPHPLAIVDLVPVRAASDLAIATEIAQPWRGSGLHGYAIAGPVQFVGNSACRIVAVWVEARGTPGKSLSVRRCLDRSGSWDRVAVPDSSSDSVDFEGEVNG